MTQPPEVFGISIAEVARLLGVSESHVHRLSASDPSFPKKRKVGGATRYDPLEIRAWFDAQRVEGRSARMADKKKRLKAA